LVGELGLFGELSFELGASLGGGGSGLALGAVAGRCAGAEFERAEFAVDDGLAFEGVVLVGGEELPAAGGEFAGGRDDRDLGAAAGTGALVERVQRPGCLIADQATSTSTCRHARIPCQVVGGAWRSIGLIPQLRGSVSAGVVSALMSIHESVFGTLLPVHASIYEYTDGLIGHRVLGVPCLMLRTTGRKTGQTRTNSLGLTRLAVSHLQGPGLGRRS
jgi:F420H(2)-dependent quinone reductase